MAGSAAAAGGLGGSTAGHRVEGNNTASGTWLLEHIQPPVFKDPAGDAANSLVLGERDVDPCGAMAFSPVRSPRWRAVAPGCLPGSAPAQTLLDGNFCVAMQARSGRRVAM